MNPSSDGFIMSTPEKKMKENMKKEQIKALAISLYLQKRTNYSSEPVDTQSSARECTKEAKEVIETIEAEL